MNIFDVCMAVKNRPDINAIGRKMADLERLLVAAREALGTLKRQLDSEERCGEPFCGDDEHEAVRLLTEALAPYKGKRHVCLR